MTVPVKTATAGDIMESVLLKGDIAKLTPDERVKYYGEVCRSMGLNPLTKPFEFITLNGKLQLYALRACTDQLRKINGISLEIVSRDVSDDILTVHVRARDNSGRADEDLGAVAFPSTLKGEARANAELKAVTKAKRRATLSICGLGWLDETEVEDIPASSKRPSKPAPNVMLPLHNAETGEIHDSVPSPTRDPSAAESPASPPESWPNPGLTDGDAGTDFAHLESMAREAASRGEDVFNTFYAGRDVDEKKHLRAMKSELVELFPANGKVRIGRPR